MNRILVYDPVLASVITDCICQLQRAGFAISIVETTDATEAFEAIEDADLVIVNIDQPIGTRIAQEAMRDGHWTITMSVRGNFLEGALPPYLTQIEGPPFDLSRLEKAIIQALTADRPVAVPA